MGRKLLSRNPKYRVIRKPGGGFEVEYDPNGHPGDGRLRRRTGPIRWLTKPTLGDEGLDSPPSTDPGNRSAQAGLS